MKNIYLHYLKMWGKCSIYGFVCIIILSNSLWANHGDAQNIKSVKEVFIDFQVDEISMEEVFQKIEAKTDYKVFYRKSDLRSNTEKISIDLQEASVEQILIEISRQANIGFKQVNNTISVKTNIKQDTPMIPVEIIEQVSVSGTITDENGEALPGATIQEKGTTNGTITDVEGKFSLSVPEDATLTVSFVGFTTQDVSINGRSTLDVQLTADVSSLEEVVVIGYGTQKKVNLTGAVEQVTAEQLETKSVATIGQALQGVVPNLNITFADGNPVKNPNINIRGGTSFSGGEFRSGSPLILVDGIPMDIHNLNPSDIESISVLKDAASAAIYGARAAYGVILVTTKKGSKEEAPRISYTTSYQIQKPTTKPKLLNSVEYQGALNNAQILDGGSPSADDIFKLDQVRNYFENPETVAPYYVSGGTNIWIANIDPWDEFLKDSAPLKSHMLSISGGSAKSNYYTSIGYRNQDGLVALGDDWRKTYNATLGYSSDVNKWLNLGGKIIYTRVDTKRPHGQGGYSAYSDRYFAFLSRIGWRSLMTPRFTPEDSPVGVMPTHSPLNAFLNDGNITTQNSSMLMKVEATVKLFEGLSFKTNYAYRTTNESQKLFLPLIHRVERSWTPFVEGFSTVSRTFSNNDYTVYNGYFDYYKSVNNTHEFSAVAGFNQELWKYQDLTAQGQDLVSDAVRTLKLTSGTQTFSDNESHWAIRGAFMRFNYIYDDKYLFEMNGRYDGTSKFPKGNRFKFFPSFSAGWRMSEESFMESLKPALTNLKLRGSYGSLGNQDVQNYAYISTYGLTQQVAYLMGGMRPIGITPPGLVSSNLTWETATTIDFGLDVTLFDKLTMNFDWYKRTTSDILTSAEKLPSVLGANVPNQNTGEMQTRGWELSTRWSDQFNNGLKYDLSFVLSDAQSEVTSFSGNPQKIISSLYEGKQMGEIWGYETVGLFQTTDEITNAPSQSQIDGGVWRPGDVRYEDVNGDGIIGFGEATVSDPGDLRIIGNDIPRYLFGLNGNVSWMNFDFNMFWQGTGKRDYWPTSYLYWGLINGRNIHGGTGTPDIYYNSWSPERTDAFYPAYKPGLKNMEEQSRYLLNAAFIRLKNITLGYTMPAKILEAIKIQNLRVYASGFNLLTISDVPKYMDPEAIGDDYPMIRSYTVGFQVTF